MMLQTGNLLTKDWKYFLTAWYSSLNIVFEAVLKVNELHMEFLSISELLVEVSDDL